MSCYRDGGCGPYEMYSCNECPASKPEYKNRSVQATSTPVATNYDRLIRKTPEELAKYLTQAWYDGPVFECPARSSVGVDRCAEVKDCEDCFLDWLRSPVEGEG